MERWTNKDEEELQEMLRRKHKLYNEHFEALEGLVEVCHLYNETVSGITEVLVQYADDFRDKLEPFARGV